MFIECFVLKRHTFHASVHQWDENRINFGVHFYCYKIKIVRIACFKCAYLVNIQFTLFNYALLAELGVYVCNKSEIRFCQTLVQQRISLSPVISKRNYWQIQKRKGFCIITFTPSNTKQSFMTHVTLGIIYNMPNLFFAKYLWRRFFKIIFLFCK